MNEQHIPYSKYFKSKGESPFIPEYLIYILDNKDKRPKKRANYHAMYNKKNS